MDNTFISKLLLKKTSKFLKVSLVLFICSLILLSTTLVTLLNQYNNAKRELIDNKKVHMIEVSRRMNSKGDLSNLKFNDADKITKIIKDRYPNSNYTVFNKYSNDTGIGSSSNDKLYYLLSIDQQGLEFLELDSLEKGTLYSTDSNEEKVELEIPKINMSAGGMIANDCINKDFTVKSSIKKDNPLSMYDMPGEEYYIDFDSFKAIVEEMYGFKWDKKFEEAYNNGKDFGSEFIYKTYVYVNNIQEVDSIGKLLENNGYAVHYTFKAFENIDSTINEAVFVIILLVAFILIITSINIIMAFDSYLKVQQKDMGILKHYGFNTREVVAIYARNINKIFAVIALLIAAYTFIFSAILSTSYLWQSFALVYISTLIPLFILNRIISMIILRRYAKQNVLKLLKYSKEFE